MLNMLQIQDFSISGCSSLLVLLSGPAKLVVKVGKLLQESLVHLHINKSTDRAKKNQLRKWRPDSGLWTLDFHTASNCPVLNGIVWYCMI